MVSVCRVVLNFVSGVTFISSFHRHAISNSISIMHIELKQRLGWQLDNILHFFESISFEAHNEVKLFLLQNLAIIKNKGTPNFLVFVSFGISQNIYSWLSCISKKYCCDKVLLVHINKNFHNLVNHCKKKQNLLNTNFVWHLISV